MWIITTETTRSRGESQYAPLHAGVQVIFCPLTTPIVLPCNHRDVRLLYGYRLKRRPYPEIEEGGFAPTIVVHQRKGDAYPERQAGRK